MRDSLLAAGGNLDTTVGGTLMEVMNRTYATGGNAPPDVVKKMHYDTPRRSVYLPVVRNSLYGPFAAFDFPEPGTVTGQRSQTTVAPQALFLMNSPFMKHQGKLLSERVALSAPTPEKRIFAVFRQVYGRTPSSEEVASAQAFVESDGWAALCHTMLMTNEFLYVR